MRVVVQRVTEARVSVDQEIVGQIGPGLCIFLGVGKQDGENNAAALADKIKSLRIVDCGGEILVISQFTLYGDCRKGNRPSFTEAAPAETADWLYHHFSERLRRSGLKVSTGRFQAHMKVALVNDGPVTFVLAS